MTQALEKSLQASDFIPDVCENNREIEAFCAVTSSSRAIENSDYVYIHKIFFLPRFQKRQNV